MLIPLRLNAIDNAARENSATDYNFPERETNISNKYRLYFGFYHFVGGVIEAM